MLFYVNTFIGGGNNVIYITALVKEMKDEKRESQEGYMFKVKENVV